MIIDRVQVAGLDAYFQVPDRPGLINLGGTNPVSSRTARLEKDKQREVSGIQLLIEAEDLLPLFESQKQLERKQPLFSISVMKEMFPGLFADPFKHRVHTIAGFDDFKRGTFENCRAMDIDGIPTLVSIGTGTCVWQSAIYPMPTPVTFRSAAWELATSKQTPGDSFNYTILLYYWAPDQPLETPLQKIILTSDTENPESFGPTIARKSERQDWRDYIVGYFDNIGFYQLQFSAKVKNDSYIYERHTPILGESIGRPLLRAVNLLEPVESIYKFYSLNELLARSSDYHLFDFPGQPLRKMTASLDLSAALVHSDNQNQSGDQYEFVELQVQHDGFTNFEARLEIDELIKVDNF